MQYILKTYLKHMLKCINLLRCMWHLYSKCVISSMLSCSIVSDSLRPHRLQPAKLISLWDSPGRNTGVGFHFLLYISSINIVKSVQNNAEDTTLQKQTNKKKPTFDLNQCPILVVVRYSYVRYSLSIKSFDGYMSILCTIFLNLNIFMVDALQCCASFTCVAK